MKQKEKKNIKRLSFIITQFKVVEKCLKKCLINSETFLKMIRIYLNNTLTASVIDVVITICTTNIKFKADVTII